MTHYLFWQCMRRSRAHQRGDIQRRDGRAPGDRHRDPNPGRARHRHHDRASVLHGHRYGGDHI
jgi:hypothetical protein